MLWNKVYKSDTENCTGNCEVMSQGKIPLYINIYNGKRIRIQVSTILNKPGKLP